MIAPHTRTVAAMAAGARLQQTLDRFFALQQHGDDVRFRQRLQRLQTWQSERLYQSHRDILEQPETAPAVEFLFTDVYGGRDLKPVAENIRRALPKALKLLPDRVMLTSATVLETAVLTQELDEHLAAILQAQLDQPLTAEVYAAAYRSQGREAERARQLTLVAEIGAQIDRYVRSRMIQTTFRMVRRPAHAAGLGSLYDFLDHGFRAMRPLRSVDGLLRQLAAREQLIMQRLLAGSEAPFAAPFTEPLAPFTEH